MDILVKGRGKVIMFLMFIHFCEVMWLFVIMNSTPMWEDVFGGSKSKPEASTTAAIMIILPILLTTWLVDNYIGTYLSMIIIMLLYLVGDVIAIIMTISLYLEHEYIKEVYPYIELSIAFVYTSATVNMSSFMDLLFKDVRFYLALHRSLFVLAPVVLTLLFKTKKLLTFLSIAHYFLFLFIIFLVLTIIFFIIIIHFKHYFRLTPVKYGILNQILCCSKYFSLKGKPWTEKALVKYPKNVVDEASRFWAVAFVLLATIIDSWALVVIRSAWKWQDSMMAKNAVTDQISTENLYNIMVFTFFFLLVLFYRQLKYYINISELSKIFISMALTIPAILMTIYLHIMIGTEIGSIPGRGYGQLRIINCHFYPIILEFNAPAYHVQAIAPADLLPISIPGVAFIPYRANYTINGHTRDIILHARERKSTTYVSISKELLVKLKHYDPVKIKKKTIDANKAVIQLLANGAGTLKIDDFYEFPEEGTSDVLFIAPGNYACVANFSNVVHKFDLLVQRNGVYTLIVIIDKPRDKVITKLHTMLSPSNQSSDFFHLPMILTAIADANEKTAVCVFIFLESPYCARCTLVGLYFFFTSLAAFLGTFFTPPETHTLITCFTVYVVNMIMYLKLFIWWGLWKKKQSITLTSINKDKL